MKELSGMGTCRLIRRLENKVKIHRRSSTDPEDGVAQWLEMESGSRIKTAVHVVVCGVFCGEKWFGGNR